VPDTCRSAFKGKNPVIRSDGTPLRDYLFIDDAVDAYFSLAQRLLDKKINAGEAFNFGTGKPISVIDLVTLILKISGNTALVPQIIGTGKIKGEIDRQYLSSTKARRMLGWRPRYSIQRGMSITYPWYKDYLGGARKKRCRSYR